MFTNGRQTIKLKIGLVNTFLIVFFLLIFSNVKAYSAVSGQQIWERRFNGTGASNDSASVIAVDRNNNIYVAGTSEKDFIVIKYDSAGNLVWTKRYGKFKKGVDEVRAIAVDEIGNIYVTGTSFGGPDSKKDYATIKYDSTGKQKWVRRYNGPEDNNDLVTSMAVDKNNNIYVTGTSYGTRATLTDYATIKYNSSGKQKWVRRYDSTKKNKNTNFFVNIFIKLLDWFKQPAGSIDGATKIVVDKNNNIYVTGTSYGTRATLTDYVTIKYSSAGKQKWVRRYNGSGNGDDIPVSMTIDNKDNVLVTGISRGSSKSKNDYATVKYNSAGEQKWVRRYNGSGNGDDIPASIAVDVDSNVYVAGMGYGGAKIKDDIVTIMYDTSGNKKWARNYNGPKNQNDWVKDIIVDSSGNIYVAGISYSGFAVLTDYVTIGYTSSGDRLWINQYNGSGSGRDLATAIAVDADRNIYVTGTSYGGEDTLDDIVTIKYSP
ncbi:MAG: SBBP repeat-containing protein [Actinobacteria bacterium]|nr:SBBP repeat-containing protein [Actinomycetota bacterium]